METKVKSKKVKKGTLKVAILKEIKQNTRLVAAIITTTGKSYPTIMRWLQGNNIALTNVATLTVICKELNVKQSDILN